MVKEMPEHLYFQLVPRHEVWMGIFPDNTPDTDDIGLYFFPKFKKSSESDSSIIDLLWKQNLVMRSSVKGRVLLVFSSRLLPSQSQEFQGSYFLWGVFCCPKYLQKVLREYARLEIDI
uniref:uncharacterized protein LOC122606475 isoform X2 n=1 Tax=Erigeron canadensis TaxID=72917 RepID=UPI001CB8DD4C|nr:uncharacterized protein LOC122606475 isoform X2 [Erigeron canadensis]